MSDKITSLFHRRKSVKNVKDFLEREFIYGITPEEFLDFNRDLIWTQLTESDKKIIENESGTYPKNSKDLTVNSTLPVPCLLKVQSDKVTAELSISQTNFQIDETNFYSFANEKIQNIIQNEGYKIDEIFNKKSLDCRVFGWFKSLYYLSSGKGSKSFSLKKENSEFSDLSKYVYSLSTNVNENGGSFVIKLPIINSLDLGLNIVKEFESEIHSFSSENFGTAIGGFGKVGKKIYEYGFNEYYSKSSFESIKSNYFNWLISSNDLIFISFEKLEMEHERKNRKIDDNFDINSKINEHVYDMIGLVDDVKVISDSKNSESYVEITGRDLMKLLIEDGSFFFNPSTTSNPSEVFSNVESSGKHGDVLDADYIGDKFNDPFNRIRLSSGEIDVFANRQNMDIGYVLKGVISQLINIDVVPGYVFDSWGKDRTKFLELIFEKNGK